MNDISTIFDSKFLNNPDEILPKRVIIDQGESELHFSLISIVKDLICLLYTSPSPRDRTRSRMPSSA